MIQRRFWWFLLGLAAMAFSVYVSVRSDLGYLRGVLNLSIEGGSAPARDPSSPTGYVLNQRHFLGTHERGETYRWIAATQDFIASGYSTSPTYDRDTVPTGRPQLLPRLYLGWLTTVSWSLHMVTGEPLPLSVEQAALWEPVISHILVIIAAVGFMGMRYGGVSAVLTALFLACFPPFYAQFLPGVLTARTWSFFLAAYSIALNLPASTGCRTHVSFSARGAIAAALALWLDPALGFPAVLITAAVGVITIVGQGKTQPILRWSMLGSSLTFAAWLLDGTPAGVTAGELRYVHPWYALAWLGFGLGLDGVQRLRGGEEPRTWRILETATGVLLFLVLVVIQATHGYKGWLYSSAAMRRLTSLDDTLAFSRATDWIAQASGAEVVFTFGPVLLAVIMLGVLAGRQKVHERAEPWPIFALAVLVSVSILAFFGVRWAVVAALVSLPVLALLAARANATGRRVIVTGSAFFVLGLAVWERALPANLQRPVAGIEPNAADLDALVYRHFSHWLASHTPGEKVLALAPPDLSDSLVFHGGCRVLMSTAWESYPGHVAASRVLSALESTEADAVIQSRELTHIILPSWDKLLPRLVQSPKEAGKDTLFARLQRWVHPTTLRAMPYRLPPIPTYASEKLGVFKVIPPEDEALSLSRLGDYFVEMERSEPATLIAQVLAQSYPDDPNAALTRAAVYEYLKNPTAFDRELTRLAADAQAGKIKFSWDRRVQRAIVLSLGRRHELARQEVAACLASASRSDLFQLTSLQAYRLHALAKGFRLGFSDPMLSKLLVSLGAEYLQDRSPSK